LSTNILVAVLGVTVAISWGVADFFAAKATKKVGSILAVMLVTVIAALVYGIVYALLLRSHHSLSLTGLAYTAVSGIFIALGGIALFIGFEAGPVSIVSPLTSMYPLMTTLFALVIFHASLTAKDLIGIVLIVIGVMVASGLLAARIMKRGIGKGPVFALLAAVTWGVGFTLLAQAVKRGDWQLVTAVQYVFGALTVVAVVPFIKGEEVISLKTIGKGLSNKFVLGAGIVEIFGYIALSVGISKSTASSGAIVTAISACYPLLTIFLALKHFDEEAKLVPLLGAFVGIAGVVMLSLG
jgi:transporter family protein